MWLHILRWLARYLVMNINSKGTLAFNRPPGDAKCAAVQSGGRNPGDRQQRR
jgi:hypothetical protein